MKQVELIGMVWYEAETFEEARLLMEDRDRLPRTYAEWKLKAEAGEQNSAGKAHLVVRATLRPQEFVQWCARHGQHINAQGRTAFANWVAAEKYRGGH